MTPSAFARRFLPGILLLTLTLGSTPAPARQAQGPGGLKLEDRILAVVDEDPILASDLERLLALGLIEAPAGVDPDSPEFRREVLERLIEQRLRFHEIERFGFEEIPLEEVEAQMERVEASFESPDAFTRRLREVGLTEDGLRQLLATQLLVLTYVEERLGARIFVGLEDIQRYYREELTPELRGSGVTVPPIEEVREQIRTVLRERRLNDEIASWTAELRRRANVEVYDAPGVLPDELPPVVDRIR